MTDDTAQEPEIPGYEIERSLPGLEVARRYVATQTNLQRPVVLEVLRSELADEDNRMRERFVAGALAMARVTHPSVAVVHDVADNERWTYLARERLLEGSLTDRMARPMSLGAALSIVAQLAAALDALHRAGILHRDIKPSNVGFRSVETPVLTDFGISRRVDITKRLTPPDHVVGTPYYMSPEHISGKDSDHRSDIYSLGVLTFQMLVGELPFLSENPLALAVSHVRDEPPRLPDRLAAVQPLVDRLMEKKPDDRFQSMAECIAAIQSLAAGDASLADRPVDQVRPDDLQRLSDPRFAVRTYPAGPNSAPLQRGLVGAQRARGLFKSLRTWLSGDQEDTLKVQASAGPDRPRIFISYRRELSAGWAVLFARELEEKHGIGCYVDTRARDGAMRFPERLERAIAESDLFVCLLGSTTLESRWVGEEIRLAANYGKPMVPVVQESFSDPGDTVPDHVRSMLDFQWVHLFDRRNIHVDHTVDELAGIIQRTVAARGN